MYSTAADWLKGMVLRQAYATAAGTVGNGPPADVLTLATN